MKKLLEISTWTIIVIGFTVAFPGICLVLLGILLSQYKEDE